jgi:hypothetical protein
VNDYLGLVIAESLRGDGSWLPVVARRSGGDWTFLLVRVAPGELEDHLRSLQAELVRDEAWYAHYFRGTELVVVYADAVFRVRTDPSTWDEPVRHGLGLGIPREQLDFEPHRVTEAASSFDVELA